MTDNVSDMKQMVYELDVESRKVGLKMNMSKTKVLFNKFVTKEEIKINDNILEEVNKYIYLGQEIWPDNNQYEEIKRRSQAGWIAFYKHKDVFLEKSIPICLKRKIFDQCVLPSMTYSSETWTLTKKMEHKLQTTQRSMERMMTGYSRRDRKTNVWIREQSKVKDVITTAKSIKWRWAGHVARMDDERWTQLTTEWQPIHGKRARGRPKTRWRDELVITTKTIAWKRIAKNRNEWRNLGEVFAQQWDVTD
eukprot:gene8022-8881_t